MPAVRVHARFTTRACCYIGRRRDRKLVLLETAIFITVLHDKIIEITEEAELAIRPHRVIKFPCCVTMLGLSRKDQFFFSRRGAVNNQNYLVMIVISI